MTGWSGGANVQWYDSMSVAAIFVISGMLLCVRYVSAFTWKYKEVVLGRDVEHENNVVNVRSAGSTEYKDRGQSSSSAVAISTGLPGTLVYTQHFVNTTGIPACSTPEPAIFVSYSGRSLPCVMFRTDSMNTNITITHTHAHSPLTVLPSLNEAFIATTIQTEYQRSFNTQTLNYSHVTQTRQHISDTSCTSAESFTGSSDSSLSHKAAHTQITQYSPSSSFWDISIGQKARNTIRLQADEGTLHHTNICFHLATRRNVLEMSVNKWSCKYIGQNVSVEHSNAK
jgi:hypothetical protein